MKAKLVKKTDEAKGTKSFFFDPADKVDWLPGQYFYFTLPKLDFPDARGATRHFTISSAPTEGKLLHLTTRIREESGFKKTLDALPISSEVEIEGPNGTFVFDESVKTQNNVFLAGGIGITPFRSFIKYNLDKNLKIPMHLIYSNGDNDFVFKKELESWDKDNEFIKVDFFDTSVSGHLDKVSLVRIFENWNLKIENSVLWTVGPPPFVTAMEEVLASLKIPASNIITEKFTGY